MKPVQPKPARNLLLIVVNAVVVGAICLVGILGWRWYSYVTAGETPYDSVGIEVNIRLPAPMRDWGCARIRERFPRAIPPYGCDWPRP